jgi:TrpR-related protein YerC/YecD
LLITRQSVKIVIIEKRIINIKYRKRSSEMSKNIRTEAVDHLFEAILCLKDKEECYTFFEDVCTINELLSLSQRFEVAKMLMDKRTYLDISEKTGASTATISRVNRSLNYGNDGYDMVFKRMEEKKEQNRSLDQKDE